MKRLLGLPLAAIAGLALLGGASTLLMADSPAPDYSASFDGDPPSPDPFTQLEQVEWDVQVHSRDHVTWPNAGGLERMSMEHGANCDGPPATHQSTGDYDEAVFLCRDHIMTAITAGGYGAIFLTPNQLADFSQGEAVIRFDVSTRATSGRDWWSVVIQPFAENVALPFDGPDLQGMPRNAIEIKANNGDDYVCPFVTINGVQVTDVPGPDCEAFTGIADVLGGEQNTSATVRTPFEIRLSRDHIKVSMLNAVGSTRFVWSDIDIPTLPFDQATVSWVHHSYNTGKGDNPFAGTGVDTGQPNTWHWDNMSISPSVPFTMIKADRRYSTGGVVNFDAPAPAGSFLRFSGEKGVTVNGQPGRRPASRPDATDRSNPITNFWHPIPEGATNVTIGGGFSKDFALWTLSNNATSTATPPATNTSTATNTPTATAPPASSSPTPTATPSLTATQTATPTRTPTAGPSPSGTACWFGTNPPRSILWLGRFLPAPHTEGVLTAEGCQRR